MILSCFSNNYVHPSHCDFCCKNCSNINRVWEMIKCGIMNYENFALFLATHSGGDDKQWINLAWPNADMMGIYIQPSLFLDLLLISVLGNSINCKTLMFLMKSFDEFVLNKQQRHRLGFWMLRTSLGNNLNWNWVTVQWLIIRSLALYLLQANCTHKTCNDHSPLASL